MCIGGAQLLVAHLGRLEVGHPGLKLRFSDKWGWARKKVKGSQVTGGHQSGLLLNRNQCSYESLSGYQLISIRDIKSFYRDIVHINTYIYWDVNGEYFVTTGIGR